MLCSLTKVERESLTVELISVHEWEDSYGELTFIGA